MRDFLLKLGLKYERSGQPGRMLNGPQVNKVWKNLDLLHEMLKERADNVIGDGSIDYLQKLQALYLMCARYFISVCFCSTNIFIHLSVKHCPKTMDGQSRIFGTHSTICIIWGFWQRPQRYISCTRTWRTTWTSRPKPTGGPWRWLTARGSRPVILA